MKKKLLSIFTILVIVLTLADTANAQIVKGKVFAGLNMSQVDGDQTVGFRKFGFHGGVGAMVPFYENKHFSLDAELEVLFSQKGSHQAQKYNRDELGRNGAYDLYLNYVEVPVLVRITDAKRLASVGLGLSYGRLVSMSEYEHDHKTDVVIGGSRDDSMQYCRHDFSVIADVTIRLYERLKFGVRYQYSLLPIRERNWVNIMGQITNRDVTQFNNAFTFRLVWIFNEDRDKLLSDEFEYHGDNPYWHNKAVERKLKKAQRKIEREQRREERRNKNENENE